MLYLPMTLRIASGRYGLHALPQLHRYQRLVDSLLCRPIPIEVTGVNSVMKNHLNRCFAKANPTSWKLTAYKYDHIGEAKMGNDIVGVGNILVKPTPELLKLQRELADAIKPFEAPTGTAAAFVTTPEAPHISEDLIHYVSVFVPDHSGDNYVPHVSIGVGTIEFLTTFSSAPFDDFTFSPAAASVYHLGEYGTAMTKLHSIPLK